MERWPALSRRGAPRPSLLTVAVVLVGSLLAAAAVPKKSAKRDKFGQLGDYVELPPGPWVQTATDVAVDGNRVCARLRKPDGLWGQRNCVFVQPGHTFENVEGLLTLQRPETWPGGSWIGTARNVRREGFLLFAELLTSNLTWNRVAIVVGPHHYYKNVNGELWRQNAGCPALIECLHGFTFKENAFLIYCAKLTCDHYLDLEKCCNAAMPCTTVTFCQAPKVIDEEEYCDGTTCVEARDYDTCCVSKARCSTLNCGYGFVHTANAFSIYCERYVCELETERDLCCEPAAQCLTLEDHECEEGRFFNPMEYCLGSTCSEKRDHDICCQPSESCEEFQCPNSFTPRENMTAEFCAGPTCVTERDTDACCEPAMNCDNISHLCSFGFVAEPDNYCDGVTCYPERDISVCCKAAEPCPGLFFTNCSLGTFFNFTDFCDGEQCQEARDREKCCQVAEPCSNYTCPYGHAPRDNPLVWLEDDDVDSSKWIQVESLYCLGLSCDSARDLSVCCLVQAVCTTFECPLGWVSTWNVSVQLCKNDNCTLANDLDTCCDPRGKCEQDYECLNGWVPKPEPVWCDNIACVVETDLDNCCDAAMPCTNLTCPENYVQRPDSYCSKATYWPDACTMEVDKDICCLRGMALEFYRFYPITARHYQAYQVQLSEFNLFFYGKLVEGSKLNLEFPSEGAFAFSPDGNYPARESPLQAIDEDVHTKWLDEDPDPKKWRRGETYVWKPLVVQLPKPGPIDAYSFHTADDIPERDPIGWAVEGSPDNQTWVVLHKAEDLSALVPEERDAETPRWSIEVPCFLPLPVHILHSASPFPCAEGDITSNGLTCTAQCETGYRPEPATLICKGGELEPRSFKCMATG